MSKAKLSREVGIFLLLLYGLGNILGAGIYVLIGKVVGISGYFSIIAFLLASLIALFTALSYMELASRYPVSAGEAVYIQEGVGWQSLSVGVGVLIAMAGLVSSATLVHGFVGYLHQFLPVNAELLMTILVISLVAISIKGIKTSVMVASLLTLIEVFGLLMIIFYGYEGIIHIKINLTEFIPSFAFSDISVIFLGAFLAFYAFIGFEDMVNIAEEVKEPARTYPMAIILALLVSTLLYILVLLVSFDTLSVEELKNSQAPFADIYERLTGKDPVVISIIGMFAVINGALIQMIMASRIVYGMASKGWLPSYFSEVSQKTRTPIKSTLLVGVITLTFTLLFDLVALASFSSLLILIVFTLVNISLIRIKRSHVQPQGVIEIPVWIPWSGVVCNIVLLFMSALAI